MDRHQSAYRNRRFITRPYSQLVRDRQSQIGWEPLHVRQGLGINQSAVTVTSALLWGPTNISTVNTDNAPVHQCGTMIINENNARIAIFDAAGKMIASTTGNYNLINLPTGVYFVRVAGYKGVACKVVKN